jgi:hypothetical protein
MPKVKRASTIKIPVNRATKSVPHYMYRSSEKEQAEWVEGLQRDLDGGFAHSYWVRQGSSWTEETWTTWMQGRIKEETFDWVAPEEFVDTYVVEGSYRGRSAAGFELKSKTTGGECCMMIADMRDMLINGTIVKGEVTGRWIFKKRGANFGISYVGEVNG